MGRCESADASLTATIHCHNSLLKHQNSLACLRNIVTLQKHLIHYLNSIIQTFNTLFGKWHQNKKYFCHFVSHTGRKVSFFFFHHVIYYLLLLYTNVFSTLLLTLTCFYSTQECWFCLDESSCVSHQAF